MEIVFRVADDVGSHTGKGDGEITREVEGVGITHTELIKQFCEVFTLDESARLLVALTTEDGCRDSVGVLLLYVAEVLVAQIVTIADDKRPVRPRCYPWRFR